MAAMTAHSWRTDHSVSFLFIAVTVFARAEARAQSEQHEQQALATAQHNMLCGLWTSGGLAAVQEMGSSLTASSRLNGQRKLAERVEVNEGKARH